MGADEQVDSIANLLWGSETGTFERFAAEDAEPNFNLIEPGGVSWRVVKAHGFVAGQPAVVPRFMGVEIIQDHVDLLVGIVGNDFVHKIKKLPTTTAFVVPSFDLSCGHIQGDEQGGGSVSFIAVVEAGEGFAVGKPEPALGPLQRLDLGLLLHTEHHGIVRGLQIEANDVCRLRRKFGIRTYTPRPPTLQLDAMPPEHPPDLMFGDISQGLSQKLPAPAGMPGRGFAVKCRQDPAVGGIIINLAGTRTRSILETCHTVFGKPSSPFAYGSWSHSQVLGNHFGIFSFRSRENNVCSQYQPLSGLGRANPLLQGPLVLCRQFDGGCLSAHATHILYSAKFCN